MAGPGSLIFAADMRVEAKDRKNPSMICAATITNVKKGKLLIHFDGFGHEYDYWCPASSTDVHPPMWSGKNGRRVNPPRGVQHIGINSVLGFMIGLLHKQVILVFSNGVSI